MAATAPETLRIGTAISLSVEHYPIVLAKTVATLNVISHCGFDLEIGEGWNREVIANQGTDLRIRFDLLGERVAAMKETRSKPKRHI